MGERKKTPKQNAAEAGAFYLLFENNPVPMILYDAKTLAILRANNAAAYLYGYAREELERRSVADLLPPDETERLRAVLKAEGPALRVSNLWRNLRKDGATLLLEVFSHALQFEGREAILVAARDVTRAKQAEEILVKLKKAVDLSSDAIFMTDENRVFTYVNPAFTALYGYSAEEVLGKATPRILRSGLVAPRQYAAFWSALKSGRGFRGEFINKRKNGKLVDVSVSATPVTGEDGGLIGYLTIQRDVSERIRAEEALRRAEENYRSIFDNAAVGIYQSTPQGRFLTVNAAMARMFGYETPEEMLQSVSKIQTLYYLNPADRAEFQRQIERQGYVADFCALCKRRDGSQIWVEENARVVRDKRGAPLYYEGFAVDVSAQKRAEADLLDAKESLERANRELALALERERVLARTDGLTGLYNYRYFFEVASREFESAKRYGYPISILMFDADGFKQINDTRGHLVGDVMLTKVGETIAAQMRSSDSLARYGGDEFVALLTHADARQALAIAERIRKSVEAFRLKVEGGELNVTLSVGVAELRRQPEDSGVERVVQRADQALYAAKQSGRNQVVLYEGE